jgi:hypothetical protein
MTRNLITREKTIIIEHFDDGTARIVAGNPRYPIPTNTDTTRKVGTRGTCKIWLSQFENQGEDRGAYSARYCSDKSHGPRGCDGMCHEPNCSKPADFFEHWRGDDARECCIPLCRRHSRDNYSLNRRAVIWVLNDGVVEYLFFLTELDPLPNGLPRCDSAYYRRDKGKSAEARCTLPATKCVKVTENGRSGQGTYEAKLCTRCAAAQSKDGLQIEILGDFEIPPAEPPEER